MSTTNLSHIFLSHIVALLPLINISSATLLPPCASSCYATAASGAYGCVFGDLACFCSPPASNQYLSCVTSKCSQASVQQFTAYARENCGAYWFNTQASSSASAASMSASTTTPVPVQTPQAGGDSNSGYTSSGSEGGSKTGSRKGRLAGIGAGAGGGTLLMFAVAWFACKKLSNKKGVSGEMSFTKLDMDAEKGGVVERG